MPEFRIQRCLGRGGFGEVYRGVMSRGGGVEVEVAIKVLRPDLEPESQGVQRLRDEGRLLGRLTHPTILRVYDLVVIQGRAALVSEYVAGEDLGRLLREDRIPPRAVFEVVAQVGAALDAAWSWPSVTDGKALHLVHRDVKPDNIRIDPHGVVKLLDFGIAQAQTVWREAQTSVNTIMGSTHYLAPERLVQQEVGPEADVFALGCTLFEALTGEALFARKSMRQMYVLMVDERRFEEFLAERCEARKDRLGGERSTALLKAMTSWRKQNRPTGAEVAARCDTISDSTEGLTLTQWCRTRTWPEARGMDGPLDGYSFVTSQPTTPGEQARVGSGPAASLVPEAVLRGPVLEPGLALPPESERVTRSADAEDVNRAPVLGESGDAGNEGPLPWSAAEMVAVMATAPEVVLRIPQLSRQSPEPSVRLPVVPQVEVAPEVPGPPSVVVAPPPPAEETSPPETVVVIEGAATEPADPAVPEDAAPTALAPAPEPPRAVDPDPPTIALAGPPSGSVEPPPSDGASMLPIDLPDPPPAVEVFLAVPAPDTTVVGGAPVVPVAAPVSAPVPVLDEEDADTEVNDGEIEAEIRSFLGPRPPPVAKTPEPAPEIVPEAAAAAEAEAVEDPPTTLVPEFRFEGAPPTMIDGEEFPTVRMVRLTPASAEPRAATPEVRPPVPLSVTEFADVPTEVSRSPFHRSEKGRKRSATESGSLRPPRKNSHSWITWTATASGAAGLLVGVMALLFLIVLAWIARG